MGAGTPCSVTALTSLPPACSISLFIPSPRGRNVSLELLPEPSPEPPSPLHLTGAPAALTWAGAVCVYSEDVSLCYQFTEILNIDKLDCKDFYVFGYICYVKKQLILYILYFYYSAVQYWLFMLQNLGIQHE